MPKRAQTAAGVSITTPIILLAAIVLDIAWAGVGSQYGRHWYRFIFRPRPRGIVVHHSASGGHRDGKLLDAAAIDADHEKRGWSIKHEGKTYHIGYHYVILEDGTVEAGRPEEVRGAHAPGYNDHLGVCVIGNFSSSGNPDRRMQPARPTEQQLDALVGLLQELMDRYDFDVDDIHRHREFGQTACPGDRFPFEEVRDRLRLQTTETGQASGGDVGP